MFEPRLNLKNKKADSTLVLLILEKNKKRIRVSTNISVPPKFWNNKTMYLRENRDFPNASEINGKLKEVKTAVSSAFEFYDNQDIVPSVTQIKEKYIEYLSNPKKKASTTQFWTVFDEFILAKEDSVKTETKNDYDQALRKHLKDAEAKNEIQLTFNSLRNNGGFVQKLEKYLLEDAINSKGEKGFALNSVGKQMKNLKAFLNWCFEYDKTVPFSTKHIVKHQEEVDNVYLSYEEIDKIIDLKLEDEELEKVRDLFIIGCETALRYSDLTRIKPEHIIGDDIHIIPTKKNNSIISINKKLIIPISSRLRLILNKLNNAPSNFTIKERTEFNNKVRKICELAKIDAVTLIQERENNKQIEVFYKKYELVSSHTCRRSFCTNRFKDGVPTTVIMAVSGHRTEKSFSKYLKLDSNEILQHYRKLLMK
jgi:integrase